MKKQKAIFFVLLLSFLFGLSLVSTGLANLPPAYEKTQTIVLNPNLNDIITQLQPAKTVDAETIINKKPEPPKKIDDGKRIHTIKHGETFAGILQGYNVDPAEVNAATKELGSHYNLKALRAGEKLEIQLGYPKNPTHLVSVFFKPSIVKTVTVAATDNGNFKVTQEEIKLQKVLLRAKGEIEDSFYQSCINAGITPSVIAQLISALSYDVDFQRDIQPGNKFTVLYEGFTGPDGEFIKSNRPLYVKLEMKKNPVEIYIVQRLDGSLGYFHADGSNIRKALLRTPIDGARITSGFGMRFHPILGYTKMHKGVDFGAPTGTPIYAAGDGVIETAGVVNGYGNFVLIRHNLTYETAYGHASRFGPGIKPGIKVKQGQIVAYVGMTGRATGPHLHYEIRVNGTQVNPAGVKLAIENKLVGKDLAKFLQDRKEITAALVNAPTRADLAKLINDQDDKDDAVEDTDSSAETAPAPQPTAAAETLPAMPVTPGLAQSPAANQTPVSAPAAQPVPAVTTPVAPSPVAPSPDASGPAVTIPAKP